MSCVCRRGRLKLRSVRAVVYGSNGNQFIRTGAVQDGFGSCGVHNEDVAVFGVREEGLNLLHGGGISDRSHGGTLPCRELNEITDSFQNLVCLFDAGEFGVRLVHTVSACFESQGEQYENADDSNPREVAADETSTVL